VLASPPKRGFSLLAWVLPIGGLLVAAAALGAGAVAWSRRRPEDEVPDAPLDADTERRLDALVTADD
jgi:cytochrome c-type biogenesis protein CcmH/NrfF